MDPAPFATVVTDLTTCHNTWFYRGVDRCFVPTETCRKRALRMGLRPDQVCHSTSVLSRALFHLKCVAHCVGLPHVICHTANLCGLAGRTGSRHACSCDHPRT